MEWKNLNLNVRFSQAKSKGKERLYPANTSQKKARVAILISDKLYILRNYREEPFKAERNRIQETENK